MRYKRYSTTNDVMKEFLIYGAELTDHGFPILPAVNCSPKDTIDFSSSFSRKLKGHKTLNVNWYLDDEKIQRVWNCPDKYITHLSYFESICGLDFTIDTQMPLAMQIWNKYRNMALDWYFTLQGIDVIPNVNIIPYKGYEWLLEGIPSNSAVCCSTIGRTKTKDAIREFCDGFYDMCDRINPKRVIIIGKIPDGFNPDIEIINIKNRSQKMREELSKGN